MSLAWVARFVLSDQAGLLSGFLGRYLCREPPFLLLSFLLPRSSLGGFRNASSAVLRFPQQFFLPLLPLLLSVLPTPLLFVPAPQLPVELLPRQPHAWPPPLLSSGLRLSTIRLASFSSATGLCSAIRLAYFSSAIRLASSSSAIRLASS